MELTEYRPYAPLAVGWRFKLVDAQTKLPLWAGDELFDARNPEVRAGARRAAVKPSWFSGEISRDWSVSHSPSQFAGYTVAQMLDTLPLR